MDCFARSLVHPVPLEILVDAGLQPVGETAHMVNHHDLGLLDPPTVCFFVRLLPDCDKLRKGENVSQRVLPHSLSACRKFLVDAAMGVASNLVVSVNDVENFFDLQEGQEGEKCATLVVGGIVEVEEEVWWQTRIPR